MLMGISTPPGGTAHDTRSTKTKKQRDTSRSAQNLMISPSFNQFLDE